MKKIIVGITFAACAVTANAFDVWSKRIVGDAEIIYKSGTKESLLIGSRGLAFSYIHATVGSLDKHVTIKVDGSLPEKIQATHLDAMTILLSTDDSFISRVANAKKIELQYRSCGGLSLCVLSFTDGIEKGVWEFETTLAEQFKDYQEKIR